MNNVMQTCEGKDLEMQIFNLKKYQYETQNFN